ncbi:MAG: hypothetical protein QOJ00_2263, partial [Actinomycetota bacterium]
MLLVFAAHAFGKPSGGFIGVDVFFVISGFLITGLLVREREQSDRISLREFYARRARRILPMALLVILSTDVAARLIFSATRARQTYVDSLWSTFFLANVHFARIGTSYFDALRPPSALQQYWSLAVEEQFYLLWPCLLIVSFLVARRLRVDRTRSVVGAVAFVTVVSSFVLCVHATHSDPTTTYFSAATRAWELGIGALTAIVRPRLAATRATLRVSSSWIGLTAIVAAALLIGPSTPFPGSAALLPVLGTAAILGFGDMPGDVGSKWALGNPIATYFGRVSYSMYLWHWPVLIFAKAYFGGGTVGFYATGIAATLALSELSYRLVEEPVRRSQWLSEKPYAYDRRNFQEWVTDNDRVLIPVTVVAVLALVAGAWSWANPDVTPVSARAVASNPDAPLQADKSLTQSSVTAAVDPLTRDIEAALAVTNWPALSPSLDKLTNDAAPEWKRDNCLDVRPQNEAACSYGAAKAPHVLAVVGDSVAVSYLPGIRSALEPSQWRIQVLTQSECPMVDVVTRTHGRDNTACVSHRRWVLDRLARLKPDVVVSAEWFGYVDSLADDGAAAQNATTWRDATARMLTSMAPTAGRLVLLGAPPTSGNLQDCVTVQSGPRDCVRKVPGTWTAVHTAEQAAATAAGATYVD